MYDLLYELNKKLLVLNPLKALVDAVGCSLLCRNIICYADCP